MLSSTRQISAHGRNYVEVLRFPLYLEPIVNRVKKILVYEILLTTIFS